MAYYWAVLTEPLPRDEVVAALARAAQDAGAFQQLDRSRAEYGAYVSPAEWVGSAGHSGTAALVAGCLLLYAMLRGDERRAEVPRCAYFI